MYGLSHPVTAFHFDKAVWTFGTALEEDLHQATKKTKKSDQAEKIRQKRLGIWLGPDNPSAFRVPTPGAKKAW